MHGQSGSGRRASQAVRWVRVMMGKNWNRVFSQEQNMWILESGGSGMSRRSCSSGSSGSSGSKVVRVAHRRTRPQSVSQGQTVIVIDTWI